MVPVSMILNDFGPGSHGRMIFQSQICQKRCQIKPQLLLNFNSTSCSIYRVASFPMTLSNGTFQR